MDDRTDPIEDLAPTVSLHEYGDILRRRRAVILQTFVLVLVVGVVVTLMSAPTYRATARVLVEAPSYNLNTIDTSNPLSELLAVNQQYSVQTQVQLLQSEDLQKKIAKKIGGSLPQLSVSAVRETEIIEVTAEGDDPARVAEAPNALLDTYIEDIANFSGKELRQARQFTDKGAAKAQKDLEATESTLRDFKQKHNVAELTKNRDVELTSLDALNNQYNGTQGEIATVRAQIASVKQQMAHEPRTNSSVISAAADPVLQAAEGQIVALEAQRAGLVKEYRPVNAKVAAVDAQIATLRKHLVRQRGSLARRNERANPSYAALQERLTQFEIQASGLAAQAAITARRLAGARARLGSFPAWESELARLQRRLDTAKADYTMFSQKREDLRLREQTRRINARVIERAATPMAPIRPKKLQNILFAGVLGLLFGLCLALLQEFLDDRINSPDEADRVLRLPNLGHIPAIDEAGLRLIRDLESYSPITEAYRGLRTNINFAAVDNPVRTIAVTSAGPAEGKSTTVANLAMAMAMDGKRVIVVDADLRRPTLHKLFKLAPSPGLTDLLVGTHTIGEVVRSTMVDKVNVIPAGSTPPNPAELLGSEAMAHFVDAVRTMADVIVFDSPPVLAVADAVLLSTRVDGVLLVVGFGETRKTSARQAVELLARARAHVLGTVLNKMDAAGRGYYYGKSYYTPIAGAAARGGALDVPPNGTNGATNVKAEKPAREGKAPLPAFDPRETTEMTRIMPFPLNGAPGEKKEN